MELLAVEGYEQPISGYLIEVHQVLHEGADGASEEG